MNKELFNKVNKYSPYFCLPFFLLIATAYLLSSRPAYKVTGQIQLRQTNTANAVEQLSSSAIIEKVVSALGLEVEYYKSKSPKQELYGDSLPVKVAFSGLEHVKYNTKSTLNILEDNTVQVRHQDTIATYALGELTENESYGRFKVLKGPAYDKQQGPITLTFRKPEETLDQYMNGISVFSKGDGVVTLSVVSGHPQKGIDLVNKLISIYIESERGRYSPRENESVVTKRLLVAKANIERLQNDADRLAKELPMLRSNSSIVVKPPAYHKLTEQQHNIFKAIEPYLKNPIDQFVQVPYGDEITDAGVRNMLARFNKEELNKQRLINTINHDKAVVWSMNLTLASLKRDILDQIEALEFGKTQTPAGGKLAQLYNQKSDSLERLRERIKAGNREYAALQASNFKMAALSNSVARIISRPEDNVEDVSVNVLMVLSLTVIAGLVSTVALLLFRSREKVVPQLKRFSQQSLLEKFSTAVQEKQID